MSDLNVYNLPNQIFDRRFRKLPLPLQQGLVNCINDGLTISYQNIRYSQHVGNVHILTSENPSEILYRAAEGSVEEMATRVKEAFERAGVEVEYNQDTDGRHGITIVSY